MKDIIDCINLIDSQIKDLTDTSKSSESVNRLDFIWGELDRLNNLAEARMRLMLIANQELPEIKLADTPQWLNELFNEFYLDCSKRSVYVDQRNMKCALKLIRATICKLNILEIPKSSYEIDLEMYPFNVILVNWVINADNMHRTISWAIDRSGINWPGVNVRTFILNRDKPKFNLLAKSFHTVFGVIEQFVNVLQDKE